MVLSTSWGSLEAHLGLTTSESLVYKQNSKYKPGLTRGSLGGHSRLTRGSLRAHSGITRGSLGDQSGIFIFCLLRACNIKKKIKTDELGINGPISRSTVGTTEIGISGGPPI